LDDWHLECSEEPVRPPSDLIQDHLPPAVLPPEPARRGRGVALLLAGTVAALGLAGAAWVFLSPVEPEGRTSSSYQVGKKLPEAPPVPPPLPAPKAPAPAPETRNLIVCATGNGHHRTITEALRSAQPGAVVRVRPGLYRESLVLDREVRVVGDGPASEVVVE